MRKMIADVLAFHERFRCHVGDLSSPKIYNGAFRAAFIVEETKETAAALEAEDAIEIVDGLCDTLYVTIGTAIEFGIDLSGWEFDHVDRPEPGMRLIEYKGEWAHDIQRVGILVAEEIVSGGTIGNITIGLETLVRVVNRACETWGIDIRPFWAEVQRSNMAKVPSGSINVKTIKPPGWTPPRMAPILLKQYGLSLTEKFLAQLEEPGVFAKVRP